MNDEDIKYINSIKEINMDKLAKIQWSKFSPDRSEQYVIRVDTYAELEQIKEFVLKDLPKAGKPFPDDEGVSATAPEQVQSKAKLCPVHHKEFRNGKFGWFCATKLDDNSWCKQKPV